MKRNLFKVILLLICIQFSSPMRAEVSVAILGDSISTGGGVHPSLLFDYDRIWSVLRGEVSLRTMSSEVDYKKFGISEISPLPPKLLWPSVREFQGELEWVVLNLLRALSSVYLNSEPMSWGYLVGRALGASAENISIAANNGARVEILSRQVDRLLDAQGRQLPRYVFIFFTGNDICAPNWTLTTSSAEFRNFFEKGLKYLMLQGKPHPQGTEVFVLPFMGVTQVLTNQSILDKSIDAFGEKDTCKALRARGYRPKNLAEVVQKLPPQQLYFSEMIPPNPARLCPTLMALESYAYAEIGPFSGIGKEDKQKVIQQQVNQRVREMVAERSTRVRSFQSAASEAVRSVQRWQQDSKQAHKQAIRLQLLAGPSKIQLEGSDMAEDCFHLSPRGQERVALSVLEEMGVRPHLSMHP